MCCSTALTLSALMHARPSHAVLSHVPSPCISGKQSCLPCRPLAAASAKVLSALAARGGVTAEIALSEGSAATLALRLLQQSLQWLPSIPGRETSLYIAQALTALAASGQLTLYMHVTELCKPVSCPRPHSTGSSRSAVFYAQTYQVAEMLRLWGSFPVQGCPAEAK